MTVVFDANWKSKTRRRCSGCSLCCRLLPVRELRKPAGKRCKHQKHSVGCGIYEKDGFPSSCGLWSCGWLLDPDTADLHRPDRSHVVIDPIPDFVTMLHKETGERREIEVIQIWIDPRYPDAHRDPALRAYLLRRGMEGKAALIRFNELEAITLFPPMLTESGEWMEIGAGIREKTHTPAEIVNALSKN